MAVLVACSDSGKKSSAQEDKPPPEEEENTYGDGPACWEEGLCDDFECERTGDPCNAWCGCRNVDEACSLDMHCDPRESRQTSCPSCSLVLTVLSARHSEDTVGLGGDGYGRVEEVELAVDYNPVDRENGEDEIRARIADVSIMATREVTVESVVAGEALLHANKEFFVDPKTGWPFQRIDSRIDPPEFRFLLASQTNVDRIAPGRLLIVRFRLVEPGAVTFWLKDKTPVLAPAGANQALQDDGDPSPFYHQVVVNNLAAGTGAAE